MLALIFAAFFLPFVLDNAASVAAAETSMAYERTYYPDTETDDNAEAVTASGTFVGTEILNLKELNSLYTSITVSKNSFPRPKITILRS
ncbi:MAG: hypothetical protein ACLR06_00525 [Christensenellaceae bacterium]